jgi:cytochrome b561
MPDPVAARQSAIYATSPRYTAVAAIIHWLIALAILVMIGVGWKMVGLEEHDPLKMPLYNFHKSLGLSVLALTILRVIWRLGHKPPPLPSHMPAIQKFAAHASHAGLYVLLIALPLSGWIFTDSVGFPAPFWGLFEMPALYRWDEATRTVVLFGLIPIAGFPDSTHAWHGMQRVHRWLGYALMALLALHVAAALKHTFVDRDGLLLRMVPRFGRGPVGS